MLKHLTLLKIRNIMSINVDLLQWFINFLLKKSPGDVATLGNKSAVKNDNMSNKVLAEELRKPVLKTFNKRKVQSPFIDNILGADLLEMQLISKFNKGLCFYNVLLIFSVNMHGLFL